MAIMKDEGYEGYCIQTGDSEIDGSESEQLKVTKKEIVTAINAENVTDVLFARILINRRKTFNLLADKIPGAEKAGD